MESVDALGQFQSDFMGGHGIILAAVTLFNLFIMTTIGFSVGRVTKLVAMAQRLVAAGPSAASAPVMVTRPTVAESGESAQPRNNKKKTGGKQKNSLAPARVNRQR